MRKHKKLLLRIIALILLIGFYTFRYKTKTLPIGVPVGINIENVNLDYSSSKYYSSRLPVELGYTDGWGIQREALCANFLIGPDQDLGRKVIVEVDFKNLSTDKTYKWIYALFDGN